MSLTIGITCRERKADGFPVSYNDLFNLVRWHREEFNESKKKRACEIHRTN